MGLFFFQGQDEKAKPSLWFVQAFDRHDAEAKVHAVREQKPGFGEIFLVPAEAHGSEVLVVQIAKGQVVTHVRTPDLSHVLADVEA